MYTIKQNQTNQTLAGEVLFFFFVIERIMLVCLYHVFSKQEVFNPADTDYSTIPKKMYQKFLLDRRCKKKKTLVLENLDIPGINYTKKWGRMMKYVFYMLYFLYKTSPKQNDFIFASHWHDRLKVRRCFDGNNTYCGR